MTYVIGNGATAYIICACLEYKHIEFKLLANSDYTPKLPNIMLLRLDNIDERILYFNIFGLEHTVENMRKYIKSIRIGYWYNNCLHETLTEEAQKMYLRKQHRKCTSSAMSDSINSYYALDLAKILTTLQQRYIPEPLEETLMNETDMIYDSMDCMQLISGKTNKVYVAKNNQLDIKNYEYVYDCSNNNIKRYTKTTIEYISKPQIECKVVYNFYDEPTIYSHNNRIILGRFATKTQLKQKDIIDYIIFNKGVSYEL